MSDQRVGASIRAVRVKRHWRQADWRRRPACHAPSSRSSAATSSRRHWSCSAAWRVRWTSGSTCRSLACRRARLAAECEALDVPRGGRAVLQAAPGWSYAPEVSFSVYGERGTIDILAFHAPSRCRYLMRSVMTGSGIGLHGGPRSVGHATHANVPSEGPEQRRLDIGNIGIKASIRPIDLASDAPFGEFHDRRWAALRVSWATDAGDP